MQYFIVIVLIGLIPAAIAQRKGRSFMAWWFYGALLFIVALPHALMMGQREGRGRKKCPYCAEMILEEATVCRFCGRDLGATNAASPVQHAEPLAEPVSAVAEDPRLVSLPSEPGARIPQEDPSRSLADVQAEINGEGRTRFFGAVSLALLALIVWFAFSPGLKPAQTLLQTAPRTVYSIRQTYLRVTPSATAQLADQVPAGIEFRSDSSGRGWLHVTQVSNSSIGWIAQEDVSPQPPRQAAISPEPTVVPSGPTTPSSINPSLVRSARKVVNAMVAEGALKSIDGPYSIVVGPKFFTFNLTLQDAICKGVSVMRMEHHQTDGFYLKDSIDNGKVGEFANGQLTMY